jgi:DNA-binding SARP family transcriptional activator
MEWSRLRIELLGQLRVLHDGEVIELPASKKTRALLGYLVATGREHTRERLCSLLWDGPDDPRAQLRWSLWKLRGAVDSAHTQRLIATREQVGLRSHGAEIDVVALRERVAGGVAAASTAALVEAVELFRGDLLEGLELSTCLQFDAWCTAERESLRQLRVAILATLVARSSPQDALRYARVWVAVDPLAEAAHGEVIRLLGDLGQVREALQQYETCERIFATELGTRPSRRLDELRMGLAPSAAVAVPVATTAPAPVPRMLIGRDSERAVLAELVRTGRGIVLVSGEPGIGKTRLLEDIGGALVGRCYEAEQVRPYGPWIDALRTLPHDALGSIHRSELAALLPELSSTPVVIDDRTRVFDAVVRALRAAGRPVVLDDIHWLDDASAALLHYVARADLGIPVALGARDEELADNAAALRVVRALRRAGLRELRLGPLSRDAIAQLAPGRDAERLYAESEGNPLFAIELARAQGETVPETLDGLLSERLDRLDERSRVLVSWAAALGRSFSLDVLGRASAMPAPELVVTLADLERRTIVRATATGYDFAHDLVRRAAYAKLSPPRRRLCHAHIASVFSSEPEASSELARHAGLAGDHELAARACVAAGLRCLRLCAHAEGGELAERGRHHLDNLEAVHRLPYEIDLLWILVHTRGVHQVARLTAALTAAVTAAEVAGRSELVVRGNQALGVLKSRTGDEQGATSAMRRAVEESHSVNPADQVQMLAQTGRCYVMLGDVARAKEMLREAAAIADRHCVDHPEHAFTRGLVAHFDGDLDDARTLLASTLGELRVRADRWRECDCLGHLAMIALERGEHAEATRCAEELGRVAEKMGGGSYEGPFAAAISALAHRAADRGATIDDELARLREIDAKQMLCQVLAILAELELAEQRPADAERHAAMAHELALMTRIGNDIVLTGALRVRALHALGDPRAHEQLAATAELAATAQLSARTRRHLAEANTISS